MSARDHGAQTEQRAVLTDNEAALAARLYPHVCPESVIDRSEHAANIARSLFALGVRQ